MSYSTNRIGETYKRNFTHTSRGEWRLRQLLEEVQRSLPDGYFTFRTSDVPGRGDALILGEEVVQVDGPPHEKQTQRAHDSFMMGKVWEEGFRPWRFKQEEVLYCGTYVKSILANIAAMKRVLLERERRKK